jgi:hypothetical protein
MLPLRRGAYRLFGRELTLQALRPGAQDRSRP